MGVQILASGTENGFRVYESLDGLSQLTDDDNVWVDIEAVQGEELAVVAQRFGLHELAIEDCLTPGHFPKFEDFATHLFIILRTLKPLSDLEEILDLAEDEAEQEELKPQADKPSELHLTRKVAVFLGKSFIVTFRRSEVQWLDALVRQAKQYPERSVTRSVDLVAHMVVDVLVDRFMRGVGMFDKIIDRFEDLAIKHPDDFEVTDVLRLKPELVALRQVARDQRRVVLRLVNEAARFIRRSRQRYFEDIDDHAISIVKVLEKQVDDLVAVRDGYLAMANARLSDTMKVLTVITTIAAPLNIIVGLYGMNFSSMPFLHHPHGFWYMLATVALISGALLLLFRSRRWL